MATLPDTILGDSLDTVQPEPRITAGELRGVGAKLIHGLGDDGVTWLAAHLERLHYTQGASVVREAEHDRVLYILLSGRARVLRGGLEVELLGHGDHFGDLGLVLGEPRSASLEALTQLQVAKLSHPSWERLVHDHPPLALHLLENFLGRTAVQLRDLTDSVGLLLGQSAVPRRLELVVQLAGHAGPVSVRTGTPVGQLLPPTVDGHPVVAALADRKAVSLSAPLTSSCDVAAMTTATLEGQRVLRMSQGLLLIEAAGRVAPQLQLQLGHSVGLGQRVAVSGTVDPLLPHLAARLETEMRALVQADLPLHEEIWTVGDAKEQFSAQGWSDAVVMLDTWRSPSVRMVSYGHVYAYVAGPLVPRTGVLRAPSVLVDQSGLLLLYPPEACSTNASRPDRRLALSAARQTSVLTARQERWLQTLGIDSVGEFNQACIRGDVSELIRVSEGYAEKRIGQIADVVTERQARGARIVTIAGPSSSGKTTFIRRLSVQLRVNGLRPIGLSLDDYYCNREDTPRDASGDYDFEALEALRLDLLGEHLQRLLAGEEVQTARYDFPTGKSDPTGGPKIRLGERDILLLEGIHGLNPRLLQGVSAEAAYRIFVCPLAQLPFDPLSRVHASDVRLLRRIIRDRHTRGASAADNIARWPSVRRGEREHIFPYQLHADEVFDTSLIYELAVLKVYAERYLLEVPHQHPSYPTAFRLLQLVDRFVSIYPDHVPPTSLLREFIGGSGFDRTGA